MKEKNISESEITLNQLMHFEQANSLGNIHGGVLMKLIDEAGGLCASRHARYPAVTVAVDSLTFLEPVHVGDLVSFRARLTYVGHTSMEAEVCVEAEEIQTGRRRLTNQAYLVYVALGKDGRPVEVPRLILKTEEEHKKWEQAEQRQTERLAHRVQKSV